MSQTSSSNSSIHQSLQSITSQTTRTTIIMLFTTPAILALLSATVAVAAPTKGDHYKQDCKKDWENKWENDNWEKDEKLFYFDAEYVVKATPDQVISTAGASVPGQPHARGIFKYGINVAENTICYNITLSGVTGDYSSPAVTATHIHEAIKGKAGPPRLVSSPIILPNIDYVANCSRPSPTLPDPMSAVPLTAA